MFWIFFNKILGLYFRISYQNILLNIYVYELNISTFATKHSVILKSYVILNELESSSQNIYFLFQGNLFSQILVNCDCLEFVDCASVTK